MNIHLIPYDKPPLTISGQRELLQSRGMIINNIERAEQFLLFVNYYRFSGYALHFEIFQDRNRTHMFKNDVTFEKVISLYDFDSSLRDILFSYIEHIEVAFRTAICYFLSVKYQDLHWYLNKNHFNNLFHYDTFREAVEIESSKSSEIFITHYKNKYIPQKYPATWMITEILSFGKWSKLYTNLKDRADRKLISDHFDCSVEHLASWAHSINILRNHCAHHSRIWNRNFKIKAQKGPVELPFVIDRSRFGGFMFPFYKLLSRIGKWYDFITEFWNLIQKNEDIPLNKMGLDRTAIDQYINTNKISSR